MKAGRVTSERSVIFKHLYQMKFQLAGSDHVFWFFFIFALVEVSDGGYDFRRHTADRLMMKTFNLNLVFDMLNSSRVDQSSFSERSLSFPDFSVLLPDDDDDDDELLCFAVFIAGAGGVQRQTDGCDRVTHLLAQLH